MKKWLKRLSVTILGIVVFLFLFLLEERFRGQISLARFKKTLAAQGEKIRASDFALPVSKGENGIPTIVQALRELKPGALLPETYPSKMELLPSGHAVVGFRAKEWVFDNITNSWEALALEWKTNEAILLRIRDALEKPVLNSELDYSQGYNLLIPNLSSSKKLSSWFGSGSELALHEGNNRNALERLLPQIRLPHLMESDRLAISELVRVALASIAKSATWEALQADSWTGEDLRKIQSAWESQEFINSASTGFQRELAYEDASYNLMRNSNEDTFKVLFEWKNVFGDEDWDPPAWEKLLNNLPYGDDIVEFLRNLSYGGEVAKFLRKQIFCRLWRFSWSHQHQLRSAKQIHRLLEITRALAKGKSFSGVSEAIEEFTKEAERRNFYDALRFPESSSYLVLSKVIKKAARAQTDRSTAICAVALQRYALRNGKFPQSLDLLVPEFLASIPTDYFDGGPMKYFLNADGTFTLYSVGEDGQDNQGNSSLVSGKSGRSIWDRKDAVWPAPATPEEVAAFRTQAAKK